LCFVALLSRCRGVRWRRLVNPRALPAVHSLARFPQITISRARCGSCWLITARFSSRERDTRAKLLARALLGGAGASFGASVWQFDILRLRLTIGPFSTNRHPGNVAGHPRVYAPTSQDFPTTRDWRVRLC